MSQVWIYARNQEILDEVRRSTRKTDDGGGYDYRSKKYDVSYSFRSNAEANRFANQIRRKFGRRVVVKAKAYDENDRLVNVKENPMSRRKRRHSTEAIIVRTNPKISPAVWVVGGLALAGAGYLTYRYFKTHITVASGAAYAVPAGAAITLNPPAGGIWAGLIASDGSQINVALGQTGPLQFTAGATGTSYTASWAVNSAAQTATITAQ
jgi:hypothetical protein